VIRVEGNHHHIVCGRCDRTEEVDCVVAERSCLEPADGHGFAIDAAEVIFRGLCPACTAADNRPPRSGGNRWLPRGNDNSVGCQEKHDSAIR
jgi:hypothetical protein